jgi:hypothetical protein
LVAMQNDGGAIWRASRRGATTACVDEGVGPSLSEAIETIRSIDCHRLQQSSPQRRQRLHDDPARGLDADASNCSSYF